MNSKDSELVNRLERVKARVLYFVKKQDTLHHWKSKADRLQLLFFVMSFESREVASYIAHSLVKTVT